MYELIVRILNKRTRVHVKWYLLRKISLKWMLLWLLETQYSWISEKSIEMFLGRLTFPDSLKRIGFQTFTIVFCYFISNTFTPQKVSLNQWGSHFDGQLTFLRVNFVEFRLYMRIYWRKCHINSTKYDMKKGNVKQNEAK